MLTATVLLAALATGGANTDQNAADACAAGPDAHGKSICAAALPDVAGGGDLRGTVRSVATSLAQSGAVPRAGAQAAAQAAGRRLMKL